MRNTGVHFPESPSRPRTRPGGRRRLRPGGWVLLGGALLLTASGRGAEDGIFADFTTSLGAFTCRLEYSHAPMAVANFIGLATGERAWMDAATGQARSNAFFAGLTFHRVIEGFMIQGGSPNGQGTDGPGYVFPDEFTPELRHDAAGVLSLANSGPNSNGAQFFITVAPTPWLDDAHTIFGGVTTGLDVVRAISQVATDDRDRPLTPVIIEQVRIRRVGPAAEAFDIHAQGLPVVRAVPLTIQARPGAVRLLFAGAPFVENFLRTGATVTAWTPTSLGLDLAEPALAEVTRPATNAAAFFALTQVRYAASTRVPRALRERTLVLNFTGGRDVLTVRFDAADGGTYDLNGATGTLTRYTWRQEPYRGRLWPIEFSAIVPMTLRLDFDDETGGAFSGTAYAAAPFNVSGAFTLSPP